MFIHLISKKQAKQIGLNSFFTGTCCRHNHICERRVSNGRCILCDQKSYNLFFKNNKEKTLQQCKQRWDKNKERYGAQYKGYRETNKEMIAQKNREHYIENRDHYLEYKKQYYQLNKEYIKQYSKEYTKKNPHIRNTAKGKRRAFKINATPIWYDQEKELIAALYKAASYLKRLTGNTYHVDHIIPLNHELVCGLHCLDNLQIMLAEDNLSKSNNFEIN